MKIDYKGYRVKQDPNNYHVAIFDRNGEMVFHAQSSKKKTAEELKKTVDFYLMFSEVLEEKGEK